MIEWPSPEGVQYWSGVATIFGLPAAIIAIVYAARQFSLARKAGSGASLIALSEVFRQNWSTYLTAPVERQRYAFADLANALETACAIFHDKVFFGNSKDILEHYLVGVFRTIQDNDLARNELSSLLQTRETFRQMRRFVSTHKSLINSSALAAPDKIAASES